MDGWVAERPNSTRKNETVMANETSHMVINNLMSLKYFFLGK